MKNSYYVKHGHLFMELLKGRSVSSLSKSWSCTENAIVTRITGYFAHFCWLLREAIETTPALFQYKAYVTQLKFEDLYKNKELLLYLVDVLAYEPLMFTWGNVPKELNHEGLVEIIKLLGEEKETVRKPKPLPIQISFVIENKQTDVKVDNRNYPPLETPVLAKYKGEWRILERRTEHPSHEETFQSYDYWDDPANDGQNIDPTDVTGWIELPPFVDADTITKEITCTFHKT